MIAYSPLHPRSLQEGAFLLIAALLWAFWDMPMTAAVLAISNYGYALFQHRHSIGYQQWTATQGKQPKAKPSQSNEAEAHMQAVMDDRGHPAKVISSMDSHRRIAFDVRLPREYSVKELTKDSQDIKRIYGAKSVIIQPTVTGKPGVSRILISKEATPPPIKMTDIIASDEFKQQHPMALPLGMALDGTNQYRRLDKLPHLIIAGTTGAGKSVEVNTWITSLIIKNTPDELQLILIDPKMLELAIYKHTPHLALPVITEMSDSLAAIHRCVNEMQYRYQCLQAAKVRDLDSYNNKIQRENISNPVYTNDNRETLAENQFSPIDKQLKAFPRMVLVIDEMADLMMSYKDELEDPLVRLAQKARACGIHLILATQRPEVKVITGLMKANISARFAMQVASRVDSEIILDRGGAQHLLGAGDGYFAASQGDDLENVQGFFIEADEIEQIIQQQLNH